MTDALDIAAIGNAIVDVIAPAEPAFLDAEGLTPGSMTLVDEARRYSPTTSGRSAPGSRRRRFPAVRPPLGV
jgi:hypothetical protein